MKKTRLAALLSISLLSVSALHAAQYRVVELAVTDKGLSTFPTAINNSGDVSVNVENLYSPIIDVSLINFELESLINVLTDIDAAKAGNLNDFDYLLLYKYITDNKQNPLFQQLANQNSYVANNDTSTLLPVFDLLNTDTGLYNGSTTTNVRAINDAGYTVGVGQGGFYKLPYTLKNKDANGDVTEVEVTFVLNDFYTRAFAQLNGNVVELAPTETAAGGLSDAFDINVNNQVVGYGTTDLVSETFQTNVANCIDETLYSDPENPEAPPAKKRGDTPVEYCLHSLNITLAGSVGQIAQRRGLIWQLDDQGNIISTKELGILLALEEDDKKIYSSRAVAINDNGIAVGESPALYKETTFPTSAAAIYIGDQVSTINYNDDVLSSTATDINNQDLVVGYITKRINGYGRKKFFIHDINTDTTTYPKDFFLGSSSVPNSINNNGFVVGYAEIESSLSNRRNEGFLYNNNDQSFTDLGSLLACDSPYIIQQANAINDNNEIVATAVKKATKRNIKGEVVLDADGVEVQSDVVLAVKLIPIEGGVVDKCDVVDTDNRDRQGASVSWLMLLSLFGLGARQFRFKRL
jgi:probable HAF family extracellular repeat protein